jgi:heme exporter protein B
MKTAAPGVAAPAVRRGSWAGQVALVFGRGLRRELRARETVPSITSFAALALVVFHFAFAGDLAALQTPSVSSGLLWVTFAFAGILGFHGAWNPEREGDALKGLLLCPVDRSVILVGKVLETLVFLAVMEAITLALFLVFYGREDHSWLVRALPVFALATPGFAAVGTLLSALSLNARFRELLLPLLFLPLAVPVLIGGAQSTARLMAGEGLGACSSWLQVLAVYDLVFLGLAFLLFEFVVEE